MRFGTPMGVGEGGPLAGFDPAKRGRRIQVALYNWIGGSGSPQRERIQTTYLCTKYATDSVVGWIPGMDVFKTQCPKVCTLGVALRKCCTRNSINSVFGHLVRVCLACIMAKGVHVGAGAPTLHTCIQLCQSVVGYLV